MRSHWSEDELQTGDLIAMATENSINIGWYLGRGKTGTLQYYDIYSAAYARINNRKLYKSYINAPHERRILKITPECITDKEYINIYHEGLELMKELKIVKQ